MAQETPTVASHVSSYSDEDVESWFDSESETENLPVKEDVEVRFVESQLRVVRSTMDLTIHTLKASLSDQNYIKINPAYQRRQRWTHKQKSLLIESLLLNIPVPPIFLFENEYNQYEIMDGRQRIESIRDYLDNRYALRSLEYWPELNGKQFSQLPEIIQRGLLRRTISAMVLLAETTRPEQAGFDVRMALFKRLNTGGTRLNPQEIRNALYPSSFNSLIIELSKHDMFRSIWGIPLFRDGEDENPSKDLLNNTLYKMMADCDIVLRFFAIKETIECGRKGSLQTLMNVCMKSHLYDAPDIISSLRDDYIHTLEALYGIFQGKPFVLPGTNRVSRPVYDALMVGASLIGLDTLQGRGMSIRDCYRDEVADPDSYEILIGRGNTIESIVDRVDLAIQILSS